MFINRRITRQIKIGNVSIGNMHSIAIQSMTNTDTKDIEDTLKQINELVNLGCDIIRIAIPDEQTIDSIKDIVRLSPIPVIADIHFSHILAIKAMLSGVHAIRINPGNLNKTNIKSIIEVAKDRNISIRIGLNDGNINCFSNHFIIKYRLSVKNNNLDLMSNLLVDEAIKQCNIIEEYGFNNIKVSIKSTNVNTTILANKKFAKLTDYPLHLGVTESGMFNKAIVKSSIGIGTLLLDGIGDTIRVSLTGNPIDEIKLAKNILESINLKLSCPDIISCPTCARNSINIIDLTRTINEKIELMKNNNIKFHSFRISIMGCIVNGLEEVKRSDIGIIGINNHYVLYDNGEKIGTYKNILSILNRVSNKIKKFIIK